MNHEEKLLEVYKKSFDISDIKNINEKDAGYLENISTNIAKNKAVFTVLVTLMVNKILEPEQDIRYHQSKMKGGFSARTIDTKYITPTLKALKLPSMAESGWLTRSLEQPYPYTLKYEGEISGKGMKESFLRIIDALQIDPKLTENFLRFILNGAILFREHNKVKIKKLKNPDELFISNIVNLLEKHFSFNYQTHGGSKLPVLAFYTIYEILIDELGRYKGCTLEPLGSHTASDRTSKSAGDIQVMHGKNVYEVVEVKLDKAVDITMARIADEKITRFNPQRYYILSHIGVVEEDREAIEGLINEIKNNHGCQLIINSLLQTIKYYLRLISSPEKFFNGYIKLVEKDEELKKIHKTKLIELIKEFKLREL